MKKVLFPILALVLALSLALPTATMVQAAPDTALLTPAWSMTTNTRLSPTTNGLGDAPKPWDDMTPWGAWTAALWNGTNPSPVSGRTIPGFESGYTWMYWTHGTPDWSNHTDQWLHAQVVIPSTWVVQSVQLVYVRNSTPTVLYDIPINDNLYVYVDETYVAGGGTATATAPPSSVTVGDYLPTGALPPPHPDSDNSEGWPDPYFKAAQGYGSAYLPETDWEIPGGLGLPPEFFSPGTHDIHVIVEEFREDGGIGHLGFEVEYEEGPSIEVDKDYRYTNVCFERDNDGDGLFNEDPVDLIDNDLDGLIDEDPVDCPSGTNLGNPLPMNNGDYQLEAVIHPKNSKVKSYNPGQYYAVSTVNVLADVDTLTILEDWSECAVDPISVLNPPNGGGCVVIVQVGGEINGEPVPDPLAAYQILNAKSDAVVVDTTACTATATLEDVVAGTTIYMYVKFGPGLKGEVWSPPADGHYGPCENINKASVVEAPDPAVPDDWIADSAMLIVVAKD